MDPDPAFQVIRIQGFDDQKFKKKYTAENFFFFFWSKIAIYLRPSYRRSLQPSKENIQHFKKCNYFFFYVSGLFSPSWIRIRIRIADPAKDLGTPFNPDLGVLGWSARLPVGPGVVHQVHVLRALQPNIHHSLYSPSNLKLRRRQGSAVWCQVFAKYAQIQNNLKRANKIVSMWSALVTFLCSTTNLV